MKKNSVFIVLITIYGTILLLFIAGCAQEQQKKDPTQTELVERGKILITAGNCTGSHSPKIFGAQKAQNPILKDCYRDIQLRISCQKLI